MPDDFKGPAFQKINWWIIKLTRKNKVQTLFLVIFEKNVQFLQREYCTLKGKKTMNIALTWLILNRSKII